MEAGDRRLIVFTVAGEAYALPAEAVREILPMARLARPPGLPGTVEGLLALDGDAVPVLCLARVLGRGTTRVGLYTPLLLLAGDEPRALLVDGVREIVVVPESALLPFASAEGGFVSAEVRWQDETLHLLAAETLAREAVR